MCCGTTGHHGSVRHHGSVCACGVPSHCWPHFVTPVTKEQQIARLERYLEGLQQEAKAVEEHIAEMKEEK